MEIVKRKTLKIAVVTETFPKLSETFVMNHIKGLIDLGMEVDIYAFYGNQHEIVNGVVYQYRLIEKTIYKPKIPKKRIFRLLKGLQIMLKNLPRFSKAIAQSINFLRDGHEVIFLQRLYEASTFFTDRDYDIIHCHFGNTAEKIAVFQNWNLMQAPLVASFHGYELDDRSIIREGMYKNLQKQGHLYIANSAYTRSRLRDFGFDDKKIDVIPVSLDTSFFTRKTERTLKPFRLITIGRLVQFKGIEYSLRSLAKFRSMGTVDFIYTIVGTGPLETEIRSIIKNLELQDNVFLVGNKTQEEIKELLEQTHVFLHTGVLASDGRVENQGLVLQEAQSMEVPVIACKVGGVSEGVIDGITGFLVEEKDTDAIAAKIHHLYSDPLLVVNMGKAGRDFVEKKYDIRIASEKLFIHYENLINHK